MTSDSGTGRLAENILYFARALRTAGMPVGPGAVLDALAAVQAAGIGTREDFYWTLHAVFVKRHEHSMLFDQAFRLFFRQRGYIERLMAMMMPQVQPAPHAGEAEAGRAAHPGRAVLRPRPEGAARSSARSSSTRASPSPTASCCSARISPR